MRDDRFFIRQIIRYCKDIEECIEYFGNDEEDFLGNKFYQTSCAFYVSHIGESANYLSSELTGKYPDVMWREIVGLRNIIVHDYGKVRIESLWETITKRVPELKESCEFILSQINSK